jgi:outer membrane protein OmpA-like peptidoglycan-associated protein
MACAVLGDSDPKIMGRKKMIRKVCSRSLNHLSLALIILGGLGLQGCLATRDWVSEQMTPLGQRVADNENRIGQTDGKLSKAEGRISAAEGKLSEVDGRLGQFDSRLGQVDAKAEKALSSLGNLRLHRKVVLTLKEGANFALNSASVTEQTRKEIDGFLSDLKGDLKETDSAVFLVAGHTDSAGSDDYNYELGTKRASTVARYLITKKGIDPTRVVTVSYGEANPLEDNKTRQGRQKNRRVEILVYKEDITTASNAGGEQTASASPAGSAKQGQ